MVSLLSREILPCADIWNRSPCSSPIHKENVDIYCHSSVSNRYIIQKFQECRATGYIAIKEACVYPKSRGPPNHNHISKITSIGQPSENRLNLPAKVLFFLRLGLDVVVSGRSLSYTEDMVVVFKIQIFLRCWPSIVLLPVATLDVTRDLQGKRIDTWFGCRAP